VKIHLHTSIVPNSSSILKGDKFTLI